jgi:hypothetical protein
MPPAEHTRSLTHAHPPTATRTPATDKQAAYIRKLLSTVGQRLPEGGAAASGGEVQAATEGAAAEGSSFYAASMQLLDSAAASMQLLEGQPAGGGEQQAAGSRGSLPEGAAPGSSHDGCTAAAAEGQPADGGEQQAAAGSSSTLPKGAPGSYHPVVAAWGDRGCTLPEGAAPGSSAWREWLEKAAGEAAGLGRWGISSSGDANVVVLRQWVRGVEGELDAGVSKLRAGALIEDLQLASTRLKRAHETARKLAKGSRCCAWREGVCVVWDD